MDKVVMDPASMGKKLHKFDFVATDDADVAGMFLSWLDTYGTGNWEKTDLKEFNKRRNLWSKTNK